jgi:hypothetical protein
MNNFALSIFFLVLGIKLYAHEAHHHKKDRPQSIHIDIEAGQTRIHKAIDDHDSKDSTDSNSSVFANNKVRLAIISGVTSVVSLAIGAGVTLAVQYGKNKN